MGYRSIVGFSLTGSLDNVLNALYGLQKESSYLLDYKPNNSNEERLKNLNINKDKVPSQDYYNLDFYNNLK